MTKKQSKEEIEKEQQITEEIKLKVINLMKETIESKLSTINKVDSKVGILVGFYFLAFIEVIKEINTQSISFILFLLLFAFSVYFLVKNFRLKDLECLYPDLNSYLHHNGKLEYQGYIKELEQQYNEIEKNLDKSLKDRREDLMYSIILFSLSLSIFALSYLVEIKVYSFILI